jgi:SAM-dependent methyltransferase
MLKTKQRIHESVKKAYGRIAATGSSCCGPRSTCCAGGRADQVAQGVGYSAAELATLPEGTNLGLSCGNPTALAELKPGETVLDLGSGAGLDAFLAAQRVGPEGRVIGVDMTPEMLAKARRNAVTFQERTGLDNVAFLQGQIEALPLPDATVDVVLSNCVLNLSPDQPAVWKEISRVLRPGGRVSISDMVLLRPLPDPIRESVEALVGCIAGAVLIDDLRQMVADAGLISLQLIPKEGAVEAMLPTDDPMAQHLLGLLPAGTRPSDYITSLVISARKPSFPTEPKTAVKVQVFDPAMCCSTGVCGPTVDPRLVRFSADLEWLKAQGATVARFNLAQQALAFTEDVEVKAALQAKGEGALPLVKVDGKVQSVGVYPTRDQLAAWAGLAAPEPTSQPAKSCCGGPGATSACCG